MTETQSQYITPGSHNMTIPSREEFHKLAIQKLNESDFCTCTPSDNNIGRIASSITWTKKYKARDKYKCWEVKYFAWN